MILRSLYELYGRLEGDPSYQIAPPGYSLQKIGFRVVLEKDGRLHAIEDARQVAGGKSKPLQLLVPGATKSSGSGINPGFLWDTPQYMLGLDLGGGRQERTARAFAAFRNRHLAAEPGVGDEEFSAVCAFLAAWEPTQGGDFTSMLQDVGGYGVFQVRARTHYVHETEGVKRYWESVTTADSGDLDEATCLITGMRGPIAATHGMVKGLPGAQPSGATIAGFNAPAYESYGHSQSHNAPVSHPAAFRYLTALNALLDGPRKDKHRIVLGDLTVVFWTETPTSTEDVFAAFLTRGSALVNEAQDEGQRQRVETFLRALRHGREAYGDLGDDSDKTRFFLLGLSPNQARIAVRFFHVETLGTLLDNLRRHQAALDIERQFGEGSKHPEAEILALRDLLDAACPHRDGRPDRARLSPILSAPLFDSVLTGAPYSHNLFATVLRRIRAEGGDVDYARAALVKAYLIRNRGLEVSPMLDANDIKPAYRLGRLFAALEKTQQDALGKDLNATIRDRFYGAASATPRTVFPRLLRTYQHHLANLEGGAKVNREKLVQEIVAALDSFPAHLDLEGQGLFAIGYYHQMRDFYRPRAAAERSEQ